MRVVKTGGNELLEMMANAPKWFQHACRKRLSRNVSLAFSMHDVFILNSPFRKQEAMRQKKHYNASLLFPAE